MGTNERLGVKKRKANGRNSFLHQVFLYSSFFPSGTWCFTPAKALIFRLGAPRRRARPGIWWAGRGASPPSKPWSFVAGHHVAGLGRAFGGSDVVPDPRQRLNLSSRGTTSSGSGGNSAGRTWCLTPVKGLILRRGAPRQPLRPVIPRAWPLAMKKPAYGNQSLIDRCR